MTDQDTPGDEPPSRSPALRTPAGAHFDAVELDVLDATSRLAPAVRDRFCDRFAAALHEIRGGNGDGAGTVGGEVRVKIVGDAEMARLHAEHKGDATTTDVLTFDLSGDRGERDGDPVVVLDVDLVLCLDEAERQASARGHEAGLELLLYAVHGVLHCVGFDDLDDASATAMHAEEDRVLEAIGVGAVFGRPEVGAAGSDVGSGGER
ncbi:MAG: rRNA maturation RNase YbeY [Planctomycetota bacterium]